ncbi:MAG: DnaJ C-terminal domain-containing protein [Burkholderiaceae bacterium]
MEWKDYYKVLGLERGATEDEVKKAYRRLARKHHPDVSKAADASTRMQEINEASEVLRDPAKRAAYDSLGERGQYAETMRGGAAGAGGPGGFRPPPDWNPGFDFGDVDPADLGSHSDFFEALFGAARRGGARRAGAAAGGAAYSARGADRHARVVIGLEDAYTGATRSLSIGEPEMNAQGEVTMRERRLEVAIPKGVKAGQQIRLTGQGNPGVGGGPAGDLYLEIEFAPHPHYRVEGRDLYLSLPVAPWEAALGASVPVPTPSGTLDVTIPPGSKAGRKLRLKGRGIPGSSSTVAAGDFYAVLEVALPEAADEPARALYRRMAQELAFNPRQHLGV